MTTRLRSAIDSATTLLADAGIDSARHDAEELAAKVSAMAPLTILAGRQIASSSMPGSFGTDRGKSCSCTSCAIDNSDLG